MSGGAGGAGGKGIEISDGGGGGAGGYGAVIAAGGTLGTLVATVIGGNGGAGGGSERFIGGGGGSGGIGLLFTGATSAIIIGLVQGGKGGARGISGNPLNNGVPGNGGAGIVGQNLALTIGVNGRVSGGMSGDDLTRADAITFTGGANTISFANPTSGLTGNIGVTGSLAFLQSSNVEVDNAITGSGSITKSGNGILVLTGANTYMGGTTIDFGTLQIGNGGTSGSITGAVSNHGTLAFNRADATTFGGMIGGTGGVTKDGAGTLTLAGANTYTGGTAIKAGAIKVGHNIALGTGTVSIADGAALQLAGNLNIGNSLTLNGTGVGGTGALRNLSGSNSVNSLIVLGSDSLIHSDSGTVELSSITGKGEELAFGGAGNALVYNFIATEAGGVTKDGTGTLTFASRNTYVGATTINGGTLELKGGLALADTGAVVVNAAGRLQVIESETIGSLAGAGSVVIHSGQNLTVGNSDASSEFSGVISESGGAGTLTKTGGGTLALTGANTYSGATSVAAGVLHIEGHSALGTGAGNTTVSSGATLRIVGGTGGASTNDALVLNGTGAAGTTGALQSASGANIVAGQVQLASNATIAVDAGSLTLRGGLVATGFTLNAAGSGTLILTGDASAAQTNIASTATLLIGDGGTTGSIAGNIANDGTLAFNRLNDTTFRDVISGTGAVNQVGAGITTLAGANTYTGATNVSGGNLRVNGSLASAVIVQNGGTLSGTGTINNTVIVESGGTLSAGQSPGTLTANTLALNAGSTSVFELGGAGVVGGTSNDLVDVKGTLTLGGTLQVNAPSAGYYRLFSYGALAPGSFSAVTGSTQGTATVLTNIAGQVNLSILGAGQQMQFWDGADSTGNGSVDGGAGTWSAANTNWTGAPNQAGINDQWRSSVGVFAGTAGSVQVEGTQAFDTLQFRADGYVLYAGVNGRLQLAGASGAGTVNTDAGVTASINTQIVDGTATGLTKVGAGTLVLAGPNTYTGQMTISAGVLDIRHATALGTVSGGTTVASGAALHMEGGITVTGEALTLNGTGIANGGALRSVTGVNQFLETITLGSSSSINADRNAGLNIWGITGHDTNVTFGGAGAVAVNRDIRTGTGGLTKDDDGRLQLFGTNTYTGVTTINGGILQVSNGRAIADAGAVVVNASAQFEVGQSETIGSLAGAGYVVIRGMENLTTGGNDASTTFSGVISEVSYSNAMLTKIGTGTLTLSGLNTYTGATTVNGGTLSVDGSIASSSLTTVNASGTLGGNGTVGNLQINDGGRLAPGNSIDALTVAGNLAFTAAASYMVEVSPANADRVNVTGSATLGGATVNASFAAGSYVTKQYTIVNAVGGVIGRFGAQVNTDLPSSFTSKLSYDANNAYLNLTLSFDPPVPTPAPTPDPKRPVYVPLNANQSAVGNALVDFFNRTGGIPLVFGALDAKGLTQASGELGTGTQQTTFDAMNLFMGVMTDPSAAGRDVASIGAVPFADETMAYTAKRRPSDVFAAIYRKAPPMAPVVEARWNVWAAGFGGSRNTDGSTVTGSNDATSSIYGTAVGADYWFSPTTVAGFALAGGGTGFAVNGGGSGRSDLFQAGAFVRHNAGSAYITAAAAYGWQDVMTDRIVTGRDRLHAGFHANSYSGRVEIGNRVVMPWLAGIGVTPYAAAQVTAFDLPSYAETGAATTFALAYAGKTVTATRSELGLRGDKSLAVNEAMLTLRGRAAWAHDFDTERSVAATFQTLPGASFVVNGAAQARNAALTTASAEMKWINGWSVAGTFEGEFSDVTQSYAGKGVVRYAW